MLTIFYDGHCPLCLAEMNHLKKHDKNFVIDLVDIHQEDFDSLYPTINVDDAMKILHGTYNGQLLLGLEVTHRAWTLVGKGFWVAPLNWPVIKTLSHWVYLVMAKYRHQISAFFAKIFCLPTTQFISGKCISGACYDKSINTDHRRK